MSYKNTAKARIRFGYLSLALFALSFSVFTSLMNVALVPKVDAAGTQFAFYWNSSDPAAKRNFIKELGSKESKSGPYISSSKILVKNGPGSVDSVLDYDPETTDKFNNTSNRADDHGEYFWSKTFYCGGPGNRITESPPESGEYLKMLYTVSLQIGIDNSLVEGNGVSEEASTRDLEKNTFDGNSSHAGVTKTESIVKSTAGGSDATDVVYDNRSGGEGTNDLENDNDKIDPQACRPGARGDISVKNLGRNGVSDGEIANWTDMIEIAKTTSGKTADGDGGDNINCDVKLNSPVSWIICPVMDIGAAATDFMFQDIVSPLLKTVPIKASSDDPGFQAWQRFRLLGNVLLVGSLLAVVYSQAKGGK